MLPDLGFLHAFTRASAALMVVGSVAAGAAVGGPAHAAPARDPESPAPAAVAVAADEGQADEGADPTPEQVASDESQRTGRPVEVVALRSEDEIVVANPDGSFTSEVTAGPQRAQLVDGSWADVDPTLVRRADGSIRPKVAAVDLALSDGDDPSGQDSPLIRLADGDRAMILDWQGHLPPPELSGAVATYREVRPGVDLRVEASAVGYSYVLVVKSADAAVDLDPADLRMDVRGEGLAVRAGEGGGLEAVDAAGDAVFAGAAPAMWDSSGERPAPAPGKTPEQRTQGSDGPSAPAVVDDGSGPAHPAEAPSTGDRTADVAMTVAGGELTVVPDTALLRGAGTTYPVFIDPAASITKSDWNYVSEDHPGTKYHKFKDDEGVGYCYRKGNAVCSYSGYVNRMYFKFTPKKSDWAQRVVDKVVFRAYETFSFTCSPSWVDLHLVDDRRVNRNTTWDNKPADGDLMVDREVAYGRGSSCDPDSDPSWVEFSDNKAESDENLTRTVAGRVKDGKAIAFSLAAKNEKDPNSWKRFEGDNATLSVTYRSRPVKPFNEKMTGPEKPCVTGPSRPFLPNDKPLLVANATDPDSANLSVRFVLTDVTTGKDVQTTTDGPKAYKAGGKNVEYKAQVDPDMVHGHTYKWRAIAKDDRLESPSWSDWCEYSVDREKPNAVPAVTSIDFPTDAANKKPGEAGKVTFSANGVKDSVYGNDVDFYEWAIGDDNPRNKADATTTGGDAQATIAASTFGPNVLYVRSVDRAGNRGDVTRYVFRAVRPCDDPAALSCSAANYVFDETTGTTAADSSGKNRPMTLSGIDRVDGQRATAEDKSDRALRFDGGADFASAASVVDTRQGFTVAAWVRPTSLAKDVTVVSQAGAHNSGFTLGYAADRQRWVFGRYKHDTGAPAAADLQGAVANTIEPPKVGEWTYLVGYFDPGKNLLTLYVDGREVGVANYTGAVWNAEGGLQVGRAKVGGTWVKPFAGDVDDLRIYPGGLDAVDIDQLWRTSQPIA